MTTEAELNKPYRERIGGMAREFNRLNEKYDAYLDFHKMEDLDELFDIVQVHNNPVTTGKIVWKGDRDLPIEIIRDITGLFEKHFVD